MPLIHATAEMAPDAPNYVVELEAGKHRLQGDENEHEGGGNVGPAPYELVLSGLAACTVATLRMYMQRKAWPAARLLARAELHVDREGAQYVRRTIVVDGALDGAQRTRLAEIA